jgi:hypothetical protein
MTSLAPRSYRLFAGIEVADKRFTASWTQDRRDYARSVRFTPQVASRSFKPRPKPVVCLLPRPPA